jgi:hypothetical protein
LSFSGIISFFHLFFLPFFFQAWFAKFYQQYSPRFHRKRKPVPEKEPTPPSSPEWVNPLALDNLPDDPQITDIRIQAAERKKQFLTTQKPKPTDPLQHFLDLRLHK